MAKKIWTDEVLDAAAELIPGCKNTAEALKVLRSNGIPASGWSSVWNAFSARSRPVPRPGRQAAMADDPELKRLRLIEEGIEAMTDKVATVWKRGQSKTMHHGAPTLCLSDIHHGEVVRADEVDGANEFNIEISRKRIRRVVENSIYLLDSAFANPEYPFAVLALAGDMVSGNIHEELRETNDAPIFDIVLDLADHLSSAIATYAERFGTVFVPCVVGNHGRIDRKPRAKGAVKDNYEYILYQILAQRFSKDRRVQIKVASGLTLNYQVYNTRYLLTHGDMFRGGGGLAGPFVPWALGDHRLRKQKAGLSQWTGTDHGHDVTVFGHWHQYFPSRTFIANGSLKGWDEYSKRSGFSFEPPQQALWLTSPEYGMTFHIPVFGEDPPKAGKR